MTRTKDTWDHDFALAVTSFLERPLLYFPFRWRKGFRAPGVYGLFEVEKGRERLIYIGRSLVGTFGRVYSHRDNWRVDYYNACRILSLRGCYGDGSLLTFELERYLIAKYNPPCNTIGVCGNPHELCTVGRQLNTQDALNWAQRRLTRRSLK